MTPVYVAPWWRLLGRLAAVVAATMVAAVLLAAPASAHATLVGTDPANGAVLAEAPEEARLTFNEPMQLPEDGVGLFDAAGAKMAVTARSQDEVIRIALPEELAAGSYVISWRAISADGHPLSGSVNFSVGQASDTVAAAPAPAEPGAGTPRLRNGSQGLQYAALLLAAGLVAFTVLLPRTLPRATSRRLRQVTLGAGLVAALAALALVPLSGAVKLDRGVDAVSSPAAWDAGLVGHEWLAASLLVTGLAIATVASRLATTRGRAVALVGAALALTSPSLVGHTRSVDPELLLVLTDIAHLFAGAIWFGGLVGLVLTLRALSREDAAGVLARFSTAAATSLAVLVAMGSVLSWRILGSWENLLHTTYGTLLLVKIGVVALAVAVAVVNRFVLLPRVRQDAGRIRRAVAVEGALLTVALLVTGFLVDRAPHPQETFVAAEQPGLQTGTAGDLRVVASLSSGTVGPNTLSIETQTLAGDPRETRQLPVVKVRSGSLDLGQVRVTRTGPGAYRVPVVLPQGGTWEVQVSVRLSAFDNPVLTLPFPVPNA